MALCNLRAPPVCRAHSTLRPSTPVDARARLRRAKNLHLLQFAMLYVRPETASSDPEATLIRAPFRTHRSCQSGRVDR